MTLYQLLWAYYETSEQLRMAQFCRQFIRPKKERNLYMKHLRNIMKLNKELVALAEKIEKCKKEEGK